MESLHDIGYVKIENDFSTILNNKQILTLDTTFKHKYEDIVPPNFNNVNLDINSSVDNCFI
jgi:hypothetical protein